MAERNSYKPVLDREGHTDTPIQAVHASPEIKHESDSSNSAASANKPSTSTRRTPLSYPPISKIVTMQKDSWVLEVAAFLFSLACFVALIILLLVYDGKPAPSLPDSVNLNAIIAILGTAIRSSLLYATAAFVSQCKWSRLFYQSSGLHDVQKIDDASRGPLGSIRLLLSGAGRSLPSIGAVIILLAVAFDPFLQQIVSYPLLEAVGAPTSSTRQALWMSPYLKAGDITEAVNRGLVMDSFDRTPDCPTGNCTWSPFISAGWCSSCEDITSNIQAGPCELDWNPDNYDFNETKSLNCTISVPPTLPHDIEVKYTRLYDDEHQGYQTLNMSAHCTDFYNSYSPIDDHWINSTTGQMFNGVWNPFLVFNFWTKLHYTSSANPTKNGIAQQCILTPCLRNYSLSVRGGRAELATLSTQMQSFYYYESIGRAFFINSPETWPPSIPLEEDYTPQNPTLFFEDGGSSGWRGGLFYTRNFTTMFDWTAPGSFVTDWPGAINGVLTGSSSYFEIHNYSTAWKPGDNDSNIPGSGQPIGGNSTTFGYTLIANAGTPENIMENIAQALTSLNLNLYYLNDTHQGNGIFPVVHVHVRWAWLILPAITMVIGLVFTVLILRLQSPSKVKLWKASSFVFLHHGFAEGGETYFSKIQSASTMDELAKGTLAHYETLAGQREPLLADHDEKRDIPRLPVFQDMNQGLAVHWPA